MRSKEWELLMWKRMPEYFGVVNTDQRPDTHCSAFMVLIGLHISTRSPDRNPRYVGYLTTLYEMQAQGICWNDTTILGTG